MAIWMRAVMALAVLATGVAARANPAEEPAVRAALTAQIAAWNAHDGAAFARLLTEDVEIVTATGVTLRGRDDAANQVSAARSTITIEAIGIRFLADDVALAKLTWAAAGRQGIETQVLRRADGGWLALSQQSTVIVPRGATPAAAATPAPASDAKPKRCLVATRDGKCVISR